MLALVAILGASCGGTGAPAGEAPAFLRLVPCGGTARQLRSDSAVWETLDTRLVIGDAMQLAALDAGDARLCFADGSIVELGAGAAIDVRPSSDGSHLEMELRQGDVLLLAQELSYQFKTAACAVMLEEVPARLRVEREGEATRLTVEQGSAVCRRGSETSFLGTCWQLVAGPSDAVEVIRTCGEAARPSETETPSPADTATPAPVPTAASPTQPRPASPTPPQPTEEAPTATPEPSPIP
ncbi:MAG: hypothetical protein ACOC7Y_03285 [Chloroflexota bacterium]